MKLLAISRHLLVLVAITTGVSMIGAQTANANPLESEKELDNKVETTMASKLGAPQSINGISSALNRPERELPTFGIQGQSRNKGVLGVLGGRFVNEDRHPSFRKSTLPR